MFSPRSLAFSLLGWLILAANALDAEPGFAETAASPRLSGTFIQLLDEHGKWTDSQWTTFSIP